MQHDPPKCILQYIDWGEKKEHRNEPAQKSHPGAQHVNPHQNPFKRLWLPKKNNQT
jgi:hypothetical protein